jgi:hypothetical protein
VSSSPGSGQAGHWLEASVTGWRPSWPRRCRWDGRRPRWRSSSAPTPQESAARLRCWPPGCRLRNCPGRLAVPWPARRGAVGVTSRPGCWAATTRAHRRGARVATRSQPAAQTDSAAGAACRKRAFQPSRAAVRRLSCCPAGDWRCCRQPGRAYAQPRVPAAAAPAGGGRPGRGEGNENSSGSPVDGPWRHRYRVIRASLREVRRLSCLLLPMEG